MKSRLFSRRIWIVLSAAVLVALSSAGLASYASAPAISPTPTPFPGINKTAGSETLALVENTVIPPRDRVDLAKRLLGVTNIPQPPTVPPPELEIGTVRTFTAENLEADYSFKVDAELVYKTPHLYMFVEVGQKIDRARLKKSADKFESVIYPKIHAVFGSEWSPGTDGDPHLYVLHSTRLGDYTAAYFGSDSEYPPLVAKDSNQHEMFFVNLDAMANNIGTPYYESVLTHEFQHMVHWNIDANEDLWVNEGMSELAPMLAGYGMSNFAPDFMNNPTTQLNAWPEEPDQQYAHYGAAFMFFAYFYQRYGEKATTALVRDPLNGLPSIEHTLITIGATDPATGKPVTLEDLFGDWVDTNLLLDPTVGDGRYAYTLPDMKKGLSPATITQEMAVNGTPVKLDAPQWGADYLQIPGSSTPQKVRIAFKGSTTVSLVPGEAHSGRYMWWSNRADVSDTRLTHTFDLTGVKRATLKFWTWYYIEDQWDYGYVEVSTDGGATWTPLATARTTTDDPHGNSYGPGYTGESQGWVAEQVDLTPYAGRQIQVRFEYITDDAIAQPGMCIDDVSIPEIGYSDDFENGGGGWVSEGWLHMDNVLPQTFLVQVVQAGNKTAPVTRLLSINDVPQGEWEITVGGNLGNAVIVVSGLAQVTTQPAEYTLVLSPVK